MPRSATAARPGAAAAAITGQVDHSQYIPANHPDSAYNPLTDQRKCESCGRRNNWRRIIALGGGWMCCGVASRDHHHRHRDLGHGCSVLCALEEASPSQFPRCAVILDTRSGSIPFGGGTVRARAARRAVPCSSAHEALRTTRSGVPR
jgi:hypothetical protein